MTNFCIVAPPPILHGLTQDGLFGKDHLILAHDVVTKPSDYQLLFPPFHSHRVILDNSVVELGRAVDVAMIHEAALLTRPSCIVLPDVMEDTQATIDSCTEAVATWHLPSKLDHQYGYMIVPQGKTLREFTRCAEHFKDVHHIRWWGIPRNLIKHIGTRRDAVNICHILNPRRHIHLLGFSDDMIDDVLTGQLHCVSSIDSAVPLRYRGKLHLSTIPEPRGDWWDHPVYDDITRSNLKRAQGWFQSIYRP